MQRAALLLFFVMMPALAAMGVLVSSSTRVIAGKTYWVCTYNVAGNMIEKMIPLTNGPCPPTINVEPGPKHHRDQAINRRP